MIYHFHCLICGEGFTAGKNNATTCSTNCRVTLSKIRRLNIVTNEETVLTDKDQREVKKLYHNVVLGTYTAPEEKEDNPVKTTKKGQ